LKALLHSSIGGVLLFPFLHNEFLLVKNKIKYVNHVTLEPTTPFGTLDIIGKPFGKPLMSTYCRMGGPFFGDPKKGAMQSLQRIFFFLIGTNSAYFKEKKSLICRI